MRRGHVIFVSVFVVNRSSRAKKPVEPVWQVPTGVLAERVGGCGVDDQVVAALLDLDSAGELVDFEGHLIRHTGVGYFDRIQLCIGVCTLYQRDGRARTSAVSETQAVSLSLSQSYNRSAWRWLRSLTIQERTEWRSRSPLVLSMV